VVRKVPDTKSLKNYREGSKAMPKPDTSIPRREKHNRSIDQSRGGIV
jgi:hypothetical protein